MKPVKKVRTGFNCAVIVIITVAAMLFLFICILYQADLERRFDVFITMLKRLDNIITSLDSKGEIVLCILALYLAKCQLPIPMSVLCVISGVVFPIYISLSINIAFSLLFFVIKYWEGTWLGGGWATTILNIKKIRFVKNWITFKGNGNPYVLAASRLVPIIPIGMVSKLYGSMHYDFIKYCAISLVSMLPRIYIYTEIGVEIYNPFSRRFIILIMILVLFTGISSLIFNIFYGKKQNQMNQTLLIYSQKDKYKIVL